ncbi:MAG: hypothetical protein EHM58_17345 [Ignavibacteriae bacterium]|nr:MAG: hypothetical protein EHM58_17345 [Ignavibacteriota bacterium]
MLLKSIWYYIKLFSTLRLILWITILFPLFSYSQVDDVNFKKFISNISPKDSVISLPDKFIVENSVSIYKDSLEIPSKYYSVDKRFGKIHLLSGINSIVFPDSLKNTSQLIIYYKNYPFNIPDVFSRFEVLSQIDTVKKDSVQIAAIRTDFIEDIFSGTNLEKSGSIFRGFTIGNNRDLTLNSGFRLQMTGKLSSDIDIVAALTDENTPIQPEGNTQKLQELDKVFIELRSKNITTTLGDIDINFGTSDFFNFSRKVQGAKGFAAFGNNNFFISAALSRGKFNTNSFTGIDGVQGPYKLIGISNEIGIIVLAGTERVFLDGLKMTRGETNDYTIDYSNGQVTFTNRRLITNASRITVDFEYSEKKYSRSLISGQANTSLFNDRLNLTFSYLRESDDKNKPIDFTLSDSDRVIIGNAGNNNVKASKSGISFVGRDSLGRAQGQYIQVDSTGFVFYRYAPGDTNAFYNVTFSFVGAGLGDYVSLSLSQFKYVGQGKGSYLPIIFLPMPVLYQSGDMNLDLKLSKSFTFHVETAVSDFDRNLFSELDDRGNKGVAVNSAIMFNNNNFQLGKLKLGTVKFLFRQKFINRLYNSLDRLNQVEYSRVWDIQDSSRQTDNISEIEFGIKPNKYFYFNSTGGRIKRGTDFNSLRGSVELNFAGDSLALPFISYAADYISSSDNKLDYKGKWIRQAGIIDYKLSPWKNKYGTLNLIMQFNGEDKNVSTLGIDTAGSGSFRFYEFKPQIGLLNFFHMDLIYRFNYRMDDIYNLGKLERQSNSYTHTYGFRLKDLDFITSIIDVVIYDRKYTEPFKSKGLQDNRTVLVTSQTNLWFFNRSMQAGLFYNISSERTAKPQVVFVKVPIGQGNYKYLGDLNGNGVADENEFILVNYDGDYVRIVIPTEQLFPTTDLQTSVSFNFNPSRLFGNVKGIPGEILNNITFDTYAAVNEKSKDPIQRNLYFLKFNTFQNEQNTITGLKSIQQDINIFENNKYFGVRLRFIQRNSFNQYYSGNERLLNVERSARLRLSFTPDLTLITDYFNETNRNLAAALTNRNWNIGSKSVVSDLTYIPVRNVEVGFRAEIKRANDFYPFSPTEANINRQALRFSYSMEGKGRLRAEIERNETDLSTNPLFLPYELTKGLTIGKSFFWTLGFEYRITNFIQATINYFGRAEGKSRVIHTGTAEVRAYF